MQIIRHFSKRFFSGAIGLFLLCVSPLAYGMFSDVRYEHQMSPWMRSVTFMESEGLMTGYPDGTFRPNVAVNRAELMKILILATGFSPSLSGYADCFPDVQKQWFAPYVCFAKESGWIEGYPDGFFHPERTVNMAEAVKMIITSRGYPLLEPQERGYSVHAWYAPYVETAYQHYILHDAALGGEQGDKDELLGSDMLRVEIAELYYRMALSEGNVVLDFAPNNVCFGDTLKIERKNNVFPMTVSVMSGNDVTCTVSKSFDPFQYISSIDVNTWLAPRDIEHSYPTSYVPLRDGKALFTFVSHGREYLDFYYDGGDWEFDLDSLTLRQLSVSR